MTRGDGHVPRVMMDSEYQSDDRVTKQFISQPVPIVPEMFEKPRV